ncbi:hypothetical protein BN2497_1611 [Janthinobacterium sp. CG23_2]|nr:hypothetical protein BN2497_1611 [Janthinobacterium sp. CG23_2]CUU27203.1 hypothetical protein BN3177_1611 [Janthinobacterium sp. CG23_2]
MAYHIFTSHGIDSGIFFLDEYLGSAVSVDFYWESVGRKLNLPIISSLTASADYDDGFTLFGDDLVAFKNEIDVFEKYWIEESEKKHLPKDFLERVKIIKEGVGKAIVDGLTLMIA